MSFGQTPRPTANFFEELLLVRRVVPVAGAIGRVAPYLGRVPFLRYRNIDSGRQIAHTDYDGFASLLFCDDWQPHRANAMNNIVMSFIFLSGLSRFYRLTHGAGLSVTLVTPPAILTPIWPSTERGCKEKARPVPPIKTLAPSPTPAVASAPTPA